VLVDDEEPSRERLRRLLAAYPDVEVAGEAADGHEAMDRIAELSPDLVFLDIQMPGCTGLEVAASLPSPRPPIVFCTAYDEYAVDAFELHAVDYLMKPVNRARLEKALERVRQASRGQHEVALDRVGCGTTRFLARVGARFVVVPVAEVLFFTSEGSVTKLQTPKRHGWMQPSLNDLEKRLDPARFFRVSRAAIVNLDEIRELVPRSGGFGDAVLSDGSRIGVSRRRFQDLVDRLART
jgi:two-component system LytT family response regulator